MRIEDTVRQREEVLLRHGELEPVDVGIHFSIVECRCEKIDRIAHAKIAIGPSSAPPQGGLQPVDVVLGLNPVEGSSHELDGVPRVKTAIVFAVYGDWPRGFPASKAEAARVSVHRKACFHEKGIGDADYTLPFDKDPDRSGNGIGNGDHALPSDKTCPPRILTERASCTNPSPRSMRQGLETRDSLRSGEELFLALGYRSRLGFGDHWSQALGVDFHQPVEVRHATGGCFDPTAAHFSPLLIFVNPLRH